MYTIPETGQRLLSVTTGIERGIPKPGLQYWYANTVARTAIDAIPRLARVRGKAARQEIYDWLRGAPNAAKDSAATRGSAIHNVAEAKILGTPMPPVDEADQPYVEGFLNFYDRECPEYEATELVVANLEDEWCGTLDAAFTLPQLAARYRHLAWLQGLLAADYKGLAVDTPIPTPSGWKTMRDLRVGDEVFGSDGLPCRVTAKSRTHWRTCYRIRFDDGSSVICDDEHRWLTTSGRPSTTSVKTTSEILETLTLYGGAHHRVPLAAPIETPSTDLPIDPYVLGCWLGDGSTSGGVITKPDEELFDLIRARGYKVGGLYGTTGGRCGSRTVYGLRTQLREAGLLGNKFVPDAYLRSSVPQRTDLLRGLMDTDGSWNATRKQAVFTTTDKCLALSVRELACSLGQRAVIHSVTQRGFGLTVQAYQVTFRPIHGFNPFLMARKASREMPSTPGHSARRLITDVELVPTVATQCISVDSPDNTYLCTEAFIPTHNTSNDVWGDAGLQLSAYRRATHAWLKDGTPVPPPATIGAVVIHIKPETVVQRARGPVTVGYADTGYRVVPMDTSDAMYEAFLAAHRTARKWTKAISENAVGEPFEPSEVA